MVPGSSSSTLYQIGQRLDVTILSGDDDAPGSQLQLEVREIRQPFTLSCGIRVEVVNDGQDLLAQGSTAFLKLYDRRLASSLRKEYGAETWTESLEGEFVNFVSDGEAAEWLRHILNNNIGDDDDWTPAQAETYVSYKSRELHDTEVAVYKRLEQYQGRDIPYFFRSVSLNSLHSSANPVRRDVSAVEDIESSDKAKLLDIPGILIEFIEGFELSTLGEGDYAPRETWPKITKDAIEVVHILDENGILNKDVRPENFLITNPKEQHGGSYKPKMIDFALCRFRRDDESDEQWGRAKWIQDEEGAIGYNMRNKLRRVGFQLDFKHSEKYIEYAPGEDD